jgi:hypothetical protein
LETPIFNLIGQSTASLDFLQSYILCAGSSATIEISTDGGATYSTVLAQYTGVSSLGISGSNSTMQNTSISLANYIGLPNLRIKFTYAGTCNTSAWVLDGIGVPGNTIPVSTVWTSSDGSINTTTQQLTVSPTVTTTYTLTTTMLGCVIGTANVTVTVAPVPVVTTVNSCAGGTAVTFTQMNGAPNGTWTISGGGTIVPGTGVFTPTTAGCFTATYTTPAPGCTDTKNFVVYPVPVITAPPNSCNAAFTLPTVATVTGFTVQYSVDGGAFAPSSTITIPTTPGCHTIQAKYFLEADCGTTVAGSTMDCAVSNTANVVIFPLAPSAPVVSPGCGLFTVEPPPTITGFDIQYSFDDGATWGVNTPPTADNCTGYRIKTRYVTSAACGPIPVGTASTIAGCIESPATVRIIDLTPPSISAPGSPTLACNPETSAISAALGSAITSSDGAIITSSCSASQTRIFIATDACGNTATTSRTVNWVYDFTPPAFTGSYTDETLGCNPTNIDATLGSATATDACGAVTITQSDGGISSDGCLRTQTRTFTATDVCGNTATVSRTVTWTSDLTPPTITATGTTTTLGCNSTTADIEAALGSATATDGCSIPTVTSSDGPQSSNSCSVTQTRTFIAIDECGNTATTSRTVTWATAPNPPTFTGAYDNVTLLHWEVPLQVLNVVLRLLHLPTDW